MTDGRRVIVSQHAIERFRSRHPDVATRDATGHIFFEVQEAFRAGRTSKRIPRWVVSQFKQRPRKDGGEQPVRFAWNEDETCCYVLIWTKSHGDGLRSWVVATTLAANANAKAAAA